MDDEDEETDEELVTALREMGDSSRGIEGTIQRKRKLRDVMEEHRDEAHQYGKRVRDAGKGAANDKALERDLRKFVAKVMRAAAGPGRAEQANGGSRPEPAHG